VCAIGSRVTWAYERRTWVSPGQALRRSARVARPGGESVLRSPFVTYLFFRILRFAVTVAVVLAIAWYAWALFPSHGRPPGVGALFTKPTSVVAKLATELHANPPSRALVPVADVKHACRASFFLRPLQGPADHVVLQVTSGTVTIERNVSCKTYAFIGPWRRAAS
jgi:hypothetical protein